MRELIIAIRMFLVLTVLTGIAYPLLVTGVAQTAFKSQANGSIVERNGKVVGSRLIGQAFTGDQFFWGRPSATGPFPYNAAASSGSNQGPLNPALTEAIAERVAALGATGSVPTDLVTASGSGLDPHISVDAANFQVARVAKARNLTEDAVREVVRQHTNARQLGFLGEPVVNVLEVNLALEGAN